MIRVYWLWLTQDSNWPKVYTDDVITVAEYESHFSKEQ